LFPKTPSKAASTAFQTVDATYQLLSDERYSNDCSSIFFAGKSTLSFRLVLGLRLESILQVRMSIKLISGTIQLAPLGPDEWSVSFSPTLEEPIETIPRGTVSTMNTKQAEICLQELGFEETRIAVVSQFDFAQDELRPLEFDVIDGQFSVVRRLGLVSDRTGFIAQPEN